MPWWPRGATYPDGYLSKDAFTACQGGPASTAESLPFEVKDLKIDNCFVYECCITFRVRL